MKPAPGCLRKKSKTRNGLKSRVGKQGMKHATSQAANTTKIHQTRPKPTEQRYREIKTHNPTTPSTPKQTRHPKGKQGRRSRKMTQEKKDTTKMQRVTNPPRTQSRPRKATQAKSNENRPAMHANQQGNTGTRDKKHTHQHA